MIVGLCKLCLKQKKLIKAHIIPRFFYLKENNRLYSDKDIYGKKRPSGSYDKGILCKDCDSKMVELDNYAKQILFDKKGVKVKPVSGCHKNGIETLNFYQLTNKSGYKKLNRFFVSVFWRASISTHEDFLSFSLARYEDVAKEIILNESLDCSSEFPIVLCYMSDIGINNPINIFSPKRIKIQGVNFYSWILGVCKIFFRVDKRKIPDDLEPFILSSKTDVLMLEGRFLNFPECGSVDKILRKIFYKKSKNNKNSSCGSM